MSTNPHTPDPDALVGDRDALRYELAADAGRSHRAWHVLALVQAHGLQASHSLFGRRHVDVALTAAFEHVCARVYRVEETTWALLGGADSSAGELVAAAGGVLTELFAAPGLRIVHGEVALGPESGAPEEALQLADERLAARREWALVSAARQARGVLLALLAERGGDHQDRMRRIAGNAVAVGRRLGMPPAALDQMVRAAELQDIGKVCIPEQILAKREPLSAQEWQVLRRHPIVGERIVSASPALAPVAQLIRSCYERYDGTGYPDALSGEAIPLGARVIAVCVAFEAMLCERPYRPARTPREAVHELRAAAGSQFDPLVVTAFCDEVAPGALPAPAWPPLELQPLDVRA